MDPEEIEQRLDGYYNLALESFSNFRVTLIIYTIVIVLISVILIVLDSGYKTTVVGSLIGSIAGVITIIWGIYAYILIYS